MPATHHPPGRLTLPSLLLTDRSFVYTRADHTDVARTIARARERMVNQALQTELREIAAQALLPGVVPPPKPIQRVRAGLGHPIDLPFL